MRARRGALGPAQASTPTHKDRHSCGTTTTRKSCWRLHGQDAGAVVASAAAAAAAAVTNATSGQLLV
jgi:hypothetical protein